MKKEEMNSLKEDEVVTVTLNLENGELECEVITTLEAGGKEYIALLPLSGEDAEQGNVYLYYYSADENGEPVLGYIDDDADYEAASDAFDEYLDSAEFDELITEEENKK